MAKGYDKNQERRDEISFLGKDLARRAGRKCELCEESGSLKAHDTQPDEEPELENLVLLCERCTEVVGGRQDDARTLRFLEGAVWNEEPAVAELAKRLIATVDATWARDTMEMLG